MISNELYESDNMNEPETEWKDSHTTRSQLQLQNTSSCWSQGSVQVKKAASHFVSCAYMVTPDAFMRIF